ncbi:hypothetical protein B0H16DRAFT_1448622 [Mycena metata]|uniref:Uncharacterized protein n=1 Tax=Mycena metata TaxID=1033252 RepID=A0AAD7K8K9_9AGAR|nr:hypothetical protein B0H16DRAFT_1448622 [Mycena metata]
MSSLKRPPAHLPHDPDTDDNNQAIDPELRLRTVRTAHSAIAESIVAEGVRSFDGVERTRRGKRCILVMHLRRAISAASKKSMTESYIQYRTTTLPSPPLFRKTGEGEIVGNS